MSLTYNRQHRCDLVHDENASLHAKPKLSAKSSSKSDLNGSKKAEHELQAMHPNLSSKRTKMDLDVQDLVAFLRQPEPSHHRARFLSPDGISNSHGVKASLVQPFAKLLEPDNLDVFVPIHLRDIRLLPDEQVLDLTPLEKEVPRSVNYPPIFREYEAERQLERDDYEGICLAVLQDEVSRIVHNQGPVFDRALDLREKEQQTTVFDRALYFVFGYDRSGYFTLLHDSNEFADRPWERFLQMDSYAANCDESEFSD
ncbi:LAME_0G09032g1_1 [Lachancea meyersii CBS 8951]|uniref:LAME_0G09032g1_1 n=1 Tax=Lachancea meyersii CBS 8951 TaxID=1266667 RepID=A0A1G4K8M7_9SACH|nr:LAME_0G09032g1_1 [Lachancea meyersii CBS 8951]